jgi:hypothetical protein
MQILEVYAEIPGEKRVPMPPCPMSVSCRLPWKKTPNCAVRSRLASPSFVISNYINIIDALFEIKVSLSSSSSSSSSSQSTSS